MTGKHETDDGPSAGNLDAPQSTPRTAFGPALAAPPRGNPMDAIFVGITFAFFGLTWAYVRGCDHL